MPYEIRKTEKGWKVFTKGTNNPHSNSPMSLARAKDQMKALYANTDDIKKEGGSNLLARALFPTISMVYDMATGKNIYTGNGRMIGGFDDDDFETLFGGAEDDEDLNQKPQDDSEAIIKLDKSEFDAEEATGEPEYLKLAKKFAKKAGYKDYNSLQLANDGKHKLMLRGVKFGSIKNNDYIIYKQHFASVAEKKRRAYLARATRIKGDWAKDRYSPNSLAINILWDGSSKTGGAEKKMNYRKDDDYQGNWGYDEDAYLDDKGKKISKEEYEKQFENPIALKVEDKEPELPPQPLFGDPSQFKPQPYDPNNPLMYMVGGRLDPDKAKAQEILEKVAGDSNPKIRHIEATPMGDNNIRKYFPNAKILKYSELADIKDISQLLPQPKSFFFLLYEHSLNSGHWTVVNRYIDNGRDTICFFCSYGSMIDAPLRWNSQSTNQQLGQDKPYLSALLQKSGKRLVYNKVQYQSKQSAIATCGAFDVLWIKANIRDGMTLQDFHEWIAEIKKETRLSYDEIVANAISNRAS